MSTKSHIIYETGLELWFDFEDNNFYYYNYFSHKNQILPTEVAQELYENLKEHLPKETKSE